MTPSRDSPLFRMDGSTTAARTDSILLSFSNVAIMSSSKVFESGAYRHTSAQIFEMPL